MSLWSTQLSQSSSAVSACQIFLSLESASIWGCVWSQSRVQLCLLEACWAHSDSPPMIWGCSQGSAAVSSEDSYPSAVLEQPQHLVHIAQFAPFNGSWYVFIYLTSEAAAAMQSEICWKDLAPMWWYPVMSLLKLLCEWILNEFFKFDWIQQGRTEINVPKPWQSSLRKNMNIFCELQASGFASDS